MFSKSAMVAHEAPEYLRDMSQDKTDRRRDQTELELRAYVVPKSIPMTRKSSRSEDFCLLSFLTVSLKPAAWEAFLLREDIGGIRFEVLRFFRPPS